MHKSRETNFLEKLLASIINVFLIFLISLPIAFFYGFETVWKILIIFIFFLISILFMIFNKNRDLGMILMKTYWKKEYSIRQELVYNLLYTLSFSTLFVKIYLPFDLFIINILLIQLPTVLITRTTLHGYLSGKMTTIKK